MSPSQPTAALAGRWSALASAHGAAVGRRTLSTALATRVPVRVQTHTRTGARAHARAHTRTRARTHTRAHTHARTRTHTRIHRATHNDTHIAPDGAPNIYGCYCTEYNHGALIEPPSHRRARTGHCSCSCCCRRRRPSRAHHSGRTAKCVSSSLPVQDTALCTHATADAQGRASDWSVGPPSAAAASPISASAAEQVRPWIAVVRAVPTRGRACTVSAD